MVDSADTNRGDANVSGTSDKGWNPSRGFWLGMGAVATLAASLAVVGVLSASGDSTLELQAPADPAPAVQVSTADRVTTPPDDLTMNDSNPSDTVIESSAIHAGAAAPAAAHLIADDMTVSSEGYAETVPGLAASSYSQGPLLVPPAPAAGLTPAALELVAYASAQFGIEIETEGQDWGASESDQVANIGAVVNAWERLPASVASAVADHAHGSLVVLSNQQGRTAGGWQPYGDVAASFYTNSDRTAEGHGASHQIVLWTGADVTTVLHELFHAYEMRNVGTDQYVAALLDDEMRSFMETAGWRLLVSDQELMTNAHEPWETVNSLFVYEGSTPVRHASNPLEDFASAAAIFYGYSDGSSLDQADISGWFSANLG